MTIKILRNPRSIACAVLIICLVGPVIFPQVSPAQGRYFKEEWLGRLPDFYPRGFDGYGRIDRITAEEVVIDDALFKLAPDIRYSTPRRPNASSDSFEPGRQVGYILNANHEIKSLWFIE